MIDLANDKEYEAITTLISNWINYLECVEGCNGDEQCTLECQYAMERGLGE